MSQTTTWSGSLIKSKPASAYMEYVHGPSALARLTHELMQYMSLTPSWSHESKHPASADQPLSQSTHGVIAQVVSTVAVSHGGLVSHVHGEFGACSLSSDGPAAAQAPASHAV